MGKMLSGLVVALVLAAGSIVGAQDSGTSKVTLTRDGAPAANVPVFVQLTDGGSTAVGSTGLAGDLQFALSPLVQNKLAKLARLQVLVYDCGNGEYVLVFVEVGAEPEDRNCKRSVVGLVRGGLGRSYAIDLTRLTVQTTGGQSFLSTRNGKLIAGGAAAALLGAAALTAGGGSNASPSRSPSTSNPPPTSPPFNATGNYPVTNNLGSDPGGHAEFIGMERNTVLAISFTGGSGIRITPPSGSKWPVINGTFTMNASTGQKQITGEGRGLVAGRSNVLSRFTSTMETVGSSQGQLTGQLTVGAGGELPGGQATVYNVAGRKQ